MENSFFECVVLRFTSVLVMIEFCYCPIYWRNVLINGTPWVNHLWTRLISFKFFWKRYLNPRRPCTIRNEKYRTVSFINYVNFLARQRNNNLPGEVLVPKVLNTPMSRAYGACLHLQIAKTKSVTTTMKLPKLTRFQSNLKLLLLLLPRATVLLVFKWSVDTLWGKHANPFLQDGRVFRGKD